MSPRPLRVCFVAYRGNMHSGGQGVYLWFLTRELARLGHRVEVLVGPPYPDPMPFAHAVQQLPNDHFWAKWFVGDPAAFPPRPRPLAILEPLRFYELASSWWGFFPEPFVFSVRAFRELAQRLRAGQRYDLVHDVQTLGWGLLGIRALGLPVLSTIHHPLSVDRRASFRRDRSLAEAIGTAQFHPVGMQAFVARHLDAVITSSHASAGEIERDFRVPAERIRMLANGLDTSLFCPRPDLPRHPADLLCAGRWTDPNKGVPILVEALALLPRHVRLTVVDEDHPDHGARRLAARLGIADRLRVTGRIPVEELVELYRRATLVVVPSLYEGFGLPAAEAMACGTPVVASAAGALPEVVAVGGGGVLVPPRDPVALAKAIAELLEQPEMRRRLGAIAPRRIAEAYGWPRIAERTAETYRQVLEARGRPASTTTSARPGTRAATASSA